MKRNVLFTSITLALSLIVFVAWTHVVAADTGLVRTTFPSAEDPGFPFYARIEPAPPHTIVNDGTWAAIVFYRDPSCVPESFNLLLFFDFVGAWDCPLQVHGAHFWEGQALAPPPIMAKSSGNGAVPVWFAPVDAVNFAMQDGVLTIGELAGLEGLLVGHADHFEETIHPSDGSPPGSGATGPGRRHHKLIINAHGQLDDGRDFSLHFEAGQGQVKAILIQFR